ncbi:MAG TPA: hypothetical protein VHR85_15800 [Nocardioides sp.]|jgi:hypothetical protein|nr:hypothetical protein [Nocardioides sp.]
MLRRPPLRAVLATAAAATVLVGGVNLASYAASHHGTGSAARPSPPPKTIKFHLGSTGQQFNGGSVHLFTAKVPKGTYNVGLSGIMLDQTSASGESYSCVLADRRALLRILNHPSASPDFQRIYDITGQSRDDGSFAFGILDATNPVAKIDRSKIVFGCLFNGSGPYVMSRVPTFTLTPVRVTNKKGARLPVSRSAVHKLIADLR